MNTMKTDRTFPSTLAACRPGRAMIALTGAVLIAAAGEARAIDKAWNVGNGNWNTAGNWSPAGVPGAADRVFIGSTPAATNATATMNVNATIAALTVTDGMQLDANGFTLTVTGDTLVSGQNSVGPNIVRSSSLRIEQGPAATDATLNNVNIADQASVSINDGATLRVNGLLWIGDGSLYGDGVLNLMSDSGTSLRLDGVLQAAVEGFTINQLGAGTIDLDGLSTGSDTLNITTSRIDGSAFSRLTINGTELRDAYDDDISLSAHNVLNMNLSNGWTMGPGATLNIFGNSSFPGPAQINGGALTFQGAMRFFASTAHAQFNAPVTLASTADVLLTPGDRLEFNNNTTVEGGAYSLDDGANIDFDGPTLVRGGSFGTFSDSETDGAVSFNGATQWWGNPTFAGVARQEGNASVIGATTIQAEVFDMDGTLANAVWTVGSGLVINADRIDTKTVLNSFDGAMTVSGGFLARLTVNITFPSNPSWSAHGDMTLTGDPNLFVTRLAGSRLFQNGNLTVGGKVQATCDLTFGQPSINTFVNATSVLRLTGNTNVYPGAAFVGAGTMHNTTAGTFDLSHQASLSGVGLINDGLLTLGTYDGQTGRASVASYAASASARMIVDIGGYTPGTQHDRLDATQGTAQLAGDLEVNIVGAGPFEPQIGDVFTILTARNGVSGAFAADPVTISNGNFYFWTVVYDATTVTLRLDDVVPLPCPADFNQDGGIDGTDVDAFYAAWGEGDPSADVNFDGGVDGTDVDLFFEAWEGGGC